MKNLSKAFNLLGIVVLGLSAGLVIQTISAHSETVEDWRYQDKNKITGVVTNHEWVMRNINFKYSGRTLQNFSVEGGWNYDRWQQIYLYQRIN
ncbi:MAG: hypothetical protein LBT37_03860 [Lactobacillaceae bacterium]|jgi:hypothetical protein|nr:hypothetical protein [Lactobacillaceae bacterium]